MNLICASQLTVELGGRRLLDRVDIALNRGQVTAIIGRNGVGKSTLLACLAGLGSPSSGLVSLGPTPILTLPAWLRARQIAFLPQIPEIAWAVTVGTFVGLGRIPFVGASGLRRQDRDAVDAALAATGLTMLAERVATTLSGGERARMLLARAMAGEPDWLLADEPLTGLDPAHQRDAATMLRNIAATGKGVVVTLHDLTLVARMADRVIILNDGKILADGSPGQALTEENLWRAYGVRVQFVQTPAGMIVDIVGTI